MPGEQVQIGPFVQGLNTYSDPSAVADNQVVRAENFDLDLDGSLKSRPAMVAKTAGMPLGSTGNALLLGYFIAPGNVGYLLGSDGLSSTYYFDGAAWHLITNTFSATAMVQFNGQAWMLAPVGAASPGGRWDPTGGFTAEPNMPKGEAIVANKFRVWVAQGKAATTNGTRLYFSNILGQPTFWQASPDFIDIGAGDGQNIVQLAVYYQALLIFRTDSIYSFSYQSDPASGTTSVVVPNVGLENKSCLDATEGYLYFLYRDQAYEFINNRVNQINQQVPFKALSQANTYEPYAVSVFNTRVIFSFYDQMYVFGLRTRTWTTWTTEVWGSMGQFITVPGEAADVPTAIANSSQVVAPGGSRSAPTIFMAEQPTLSDSEEFTCYFQTKNYNYEAASMYKRLLWWGADVVFRGQLRATVRPISYSQTVTWGQLLANATWGGSRQYTWAQPLSGLLDVSNTVNSDSGGSMRKFVRFMKSLRFRQVTYLMEFDTDGTQSSAPVRLFSLGTYVVAKEHVSKQIT